MVLLCYFNKVFGFDFCLFIKRVCNENILFIVYSFCYSNYDVLRMLVDVDLVYFRYYFYF